MEVLLIILIVLMAIFLLFDVILPAIKDKKIELPMEKANVVIVSKRISGNFGGAGKFFVTAEFEDSHRKEFKIDFKEFGLIAEGDKGELTFKGEQYISFARTENIQLKQSIKEYCNHCGAIFAEGMTQCQSCGAARTKQNAT